MNAEPLRVAIVETLPEVHLAIDGLLENAGDLCIVGHARSLEELIAIGLSGLDVLVADLLTCMGFPAALARLRALYPGLRLIVTTMHGGREYEEAIARLCPEAWLSKPDLGGLLISMLRAVRVSAVRRPSPSDHTGYPSGL